MSFDKRGHILNQIQKVRHKITRNAVQVVCPFHPDRNPSGSINLTGKGAPMGWFKCWSCPATEPWDVYAQKVGLLPFGDEERTSSKQYMDPSRFKSDFLPEDDQDIMEKQLAGIEFEELQAKEWRGIPTKYLKKVGAKLGHDSNYGATFVILPVFVHGTQRGFVRAHLEKPKKGTSYINSKGGWSATYGLLFFDYAVKMMRKKGLHTLVLCEGPRDALRLLMNGIPAVAVLGAENFNEDKRFQLEQLPELEQIILFMDGDDAGIAATKKIAKVCKGVIPVKYKALWKLRTPQLNVLGKQRKKDLGNGKFKLLWENELDPYSCPQEIIDKLKEALA